MKLHSRINGVLLRSKGDSYSTIQEARIELVPHNGGIAAAIVDHNDRLIAWAKTGWQDITNVVDVAWDWVRKDFRFVPKKVKKSA